MNAAFSIPVPRAVRRSFSCNRTPLYLLTLSDFARSSHHLSDRHMYRFTISEIDRMIAAMRLPSFIKTDNKIIVPIDIAFGMLLYRLAVPVRLMEIHEWFDVDPTVCSRIISEMTDLLIGMFDAHLAWWPGLTASKIDDYRQAITRREPSVTQIWAFIDGNAHHIARPSVNQAAAYNGKERAHCQKYQAVVTPDGLCVSNRGAFGGSRHDSMIVHLSNIDLDLIQVTIMPDGSLAFIYGDSAYRGHRFITFPFISPSPYEHDKIDYNVLMVQLRIKVENFFAKQSQYFNSLEMKRKERTGLIPTAALYKLTTLFTNCHTCLHGSLAGLGTIQPPTLEQYLM